MRRLMPLLFGSVVAVALIVYLRSRPGGNPAAGTELALDFRGARPPADPWKLSGRGAADLIHPEAGGLRVTLPTGLNPSDPTGIAFGPVVRGDFDVSCGYEIVSLEKPTKGWGVGFELFIQTETPGREAFALERMLRREGDDVYLCSRNTTVDGKREFHTNHIPAAGTTGRLRVTRTGRELTAWVAEETGDYRELGRYDLGPEDLQMVRFAAHPGVAQNAVDVRIADVKVRYDPASAVAVAAPASFGWGWLARAEINGLIITLALLGIWAIVRRRIRASPGREAGVDAIPAQPDLTARARRVFAVMALFMFAGLAAIGLVYAAPPPKPGELHDLLVHDFRGGQPLPPTITLYHEGDAEYVKPEPGGTRISLPSSYIHPWGGVGFNANTSISGDFEITAAVEIRNADLPQAGFGVGAAMRIEKTDMTAGAATIARVRRAGDNPLVFCDHTVARPDGDGLRVETGGKPCVDMVGRLRLQRIGTTLRYLWGRGATGDDFDEVHRCEFGAEDVDRVRLTALTGRQPCAVDVRLLDLTIRNGPATATVKPRRWLAGAAMLLGIGLVLTVSQWLAGPRTSPRPAAAWTKRTRMAWLIAVLIPLVAAGGWYLLPRQAKPRRSFLNVSLGQEYVGDVEEEGFSYQEFDQQRHPFRWTNGKARLVIPIDRTSPPQALRVQVAVYRPGTQKARLEIVANGQSVFKGDIHQGPSEVMVDLRQRDLGEQLTLDILSDTFLPVARPAGLRPGASDDARALGVQVHGITLLATMPGIEEPNIQQR